MNITLRKVSTSRALSQETPAFSAAIVVDGVAAASISNSGTGGSCIVRVLDNAAYDALEEFAKRTFGLIEPIDMVAYALLDRRDAEAQLKRAFKAHVVLVERDAEPGAYVTYSLKKPVPPVDEQRAYAIAHLLPVHPGATILNGDAAATEAFLERAYGWDASAARYSQ